MRPPAHRWPLSLPAAGGEGTRCPSPSTSDHARTPIVDTCPGQTNALGSRHGAERALGSCPARGAGSTPAVRIPLQHTTSLHQTRPVQKHRPGRFSWPQPRMECSRYRTGAQPTSARTEAGPCFLVPGASLEKGLMGHGSIVPSEPKSGPPSESTSCEGPEWARGARVTPGRPRSAGTVPTPGLVDRLSGQW
jgi:hypothetical protein